MKCNVSAILAPLVLTLFLAPRPAYSDTIQMFSVTVSKGTVGGTETITLPTFVEEVREIRVNGDVGEQKVTVINEEIFELDLGPEIEIFNTYVFDYTIPWPEPPPPPEPPVFLPIPIPDDVNIFLIPSTRSNDKLAGFELGSVRLLQALILGSSGRTFEGATFHVSSDALESLIPMGFIDLFDVLPGREFPVAVFSVPGEEVIANVPEPSMFWLTGLGLGVIMLRTARCKDALMRKISGRFILKDESATIVDCFVTFRVCCRLVRRFALEHTVALELLYGVERTLPATLVRMENCSANSAAPHCMAENGSGDCLSPR